MAITDPGSVSAAVAEISTTVGAGTYTLSGAIAAKARSSYFRFADFYGNGEAVTYRVTDTSYTEIVKGIYSANTLTRGTLLHSTTNAFIDWPTTGQRIIQPVPPAIPLCPTAPTIGQVLTWDGTEWCPATLGSPAAPLPMVATVCPTPPLNGQILIWSAAENAYCPADFCALVAACTAPP